MCFKVFIILSLAMLVIILIVVILVAVYFFNNRKNQNNTNWENRVKYTNECKINVVDNDDVMIKILSLSEDDKSMTLHIQAQLKSYHSEDVHFYFSVDSINSLRANEPKFYDVNNTNVNYWHMEIPKETGSIFWFSPISLNMTDIALKVQVYRWEPEYAYQNTIFEKAFHLYPYWKDKATKFVRDIDESEIAIINNEKLYLSINYITEDTHYHSVHISWFFENKTNKELSTRLNDWEVNWMAVNLKSTIYDLWNLPAWCSGYFSYYLAQELKDLWLGSIKDIKTLKLIF